MKKLLLALLLSASILAACDNGSSGEPCDCKEGINGIANQTVQGDPGPCDEYRVKGTCVHTKECESRKGTGQ